MFRISQIAADSRRQMRPFLFRQYGEIRALFLHNPEFICKKGRLMVLFVKNNFEMEN